MRLILIGCEYAGTTTLAEAIVRWAEKAMGAFVQARAALRGQRVYGPLYFDYLHDLAPDDPIMQTRNAFDGMIIDGAPESVLVLVSASAEAIEARMKATPHRNQVLREGDAEDVLRRFQDEFDRSKLPNKLAIDTTEATVEESAAELVRKLQPFLTAADRERMASHRGF